MLEEQRFYRDDHNAFQEARTALSFKPNNPEIKSFLAMLETRSSGNL